jgi:hypothetical protein
MNGRAGNTIFILVILEVNEMASISEMKSLKYMRSMLAVKLKDPNMENFSPLALDGFINFGQFDVAERLLKINKKWFTKKQTLNLTAGVGSLPTDCLEIETLTLSDGTPVVEIAASDIGLIYASSMYEPSLSNPYFVQLANSLYVFPNTISVTALYFIQKPLVLSADANETIIPVEFVSMIIAYGEWQGAEIAEMDPIIKKNEYDKMFKETEERLRKDVEVKTPGEE